MIQRLQSVPVLKSPSLIMVKEYQIPLRKNSLIHSSRLRTRRKAPALASTTQSYSLKITTGKIGFVSEEGKGSTFFLFIPLFVNEASKKKNLKKERRATREFVKVRGLIRQRLNSIDSLRGDCSVFIVHH